MNTSFIPRLLLTAHIACMALLCSARTYNITDYGAVADTLHLSTDALQRAIDDCHSHGGGIVSVPPGIYMITGVTMRSNVELHISAGATIYASRESSHYARRPVTAMIEAVGADNIALSGMGTLHCRARREQYQRKQHVGPPDSVTGREIVNAIKYGVDYRTKYRRVEPSIGIINLRECTNVHLRDVQVIESSGWSVHLQWCERVVVDGLYVMSDDSCGVNADGLDIDGCSRVAISNCVVDTGDDALCLKTTDHNGEARKCAQITVSNCTFRSSSAAIKIGTETHADFENITISNCTVDKANRGINMIVRDGGNVRNVIFANIIITNERKATFWWGNGDAIWLTTQRRKPSPQAGSVENVVFANILADTMSGVRVEGFDSTMRDLRFDNVRVRMMPENAADKRSRDAFYFCGVDGLTLNDCSVSWDTDHPEPAWQSAFHFDHVTRLRTSGLEAPAAPQSSYPAIRR